MIKSETVLVKDKRGIPSIMERFGKCLHREVDPTIKGDAVHPMFIIRGEEVDAIYLPKYLSSMFDGIPYSLPMQTPATSINIDEVIECHKLKGDGWHTLTAVEWKFIEDYNNLCKKEPHGNTRHGNFHGDIAENGIKSSVHSELTLTGSGPDTWYTGHTKEGIADFVGNVWKLVTGLRMSRGVYQYIKDNDAAASDCDLSQNSTEWENVIIDGKPLKAEFNDELHIKATDAKPSNSYGGYAWKDVHIDVEDIPDFVKAIGILPAKHEDNIALCYIDTEESEVIPIRGGSCDTASSAGSSALLLYHLRSSAYWNVGFFSAYYEKNPVS
jgi:hypothetical protein